MDSELAGLVVLRRALHEEPELRLGEVLTSRRIAAELESLGLAPIPVAGTGLVAEMIFSANGPRVLVRADMDAYPVDDAKTVAYASRCPGATHACGHDVHMTAAVGLARRLRAIPPTIGSVTFVFQPAEEIPYGEESGARLVLEAGVLAETYDAILGLHCWPSLPVGTIGLEPSIAMAAKDAFRIDVTGASAHAASPSQGRDAILGIASIVSGLHAAIAREHDSGQLVVFNIGTIEGGRSQSSLARHASATGTVRTHDAEVRDRIKTAMERFVRHTARALDLEAAVEWANEMPAVENDSALVELATGVFQSIDIVREVARVEAPPMTSDDFALYGARGPSLYMKLGVTGSGGGGAPLHAADFDVDEECLLVGVEALDALTRAIVSGDRR